MASGIGSFLGGLAQGYQTSQEMEQRQQAIERDKERMALDKDRFAIEKSRAEREAEMGALAKQQTEMQIAAAKREEEFIQDQKALYAQFQALSKAGYEAEEITPEGKSLGVRRFQDGPTAVAEAKARGNMFKPGSLRPAPELDSTQKAILFRDLNNQNLIKHAKFTPEIAEAARRQDKELASEGALDALKYFEVTGDVAGAKKMFNDVPNSKIKIPDDVMLKRVPDDLLGGIKTVGTVMRNGKEEVVFDSFLNVILPSMGPKEYAAFQAQQRLEGQRQKGESERTDKRIAADITTTGMTNRAAMDREVYRALKDVQIAAMKDNAGGEDKIGKQLREILFPLAEKQASNPNNVFNSDFYRKNVIDQLSRARYLFDSGKAKSLEEAAAASLRELPYNPPK